MTANDIGHLDEATLAGFLDGELADDERERAAAHLEECRECRAELRELGVLAESAPVTATRERPHRIGRFAITAGALAASLAGVAVLRQMPSTSRLESATRVRAVPEGAGRIDVVAPAHRDVPMANVVFVWRSSNVDVYRFTLMNESAQVLFTSATTDTSMAWPHDVAPALGASYFWSVDGIAGGVVSSTGAQRLRLVP
jgi:hypothetical protein